MRVISNRALVRFASVHSEACAPLQSWRKILEAGTFPSFAELKQAFGATDKVGDFYVFHVGGNKYRLICSIHFNRQMVFVRHIFTHEEYDGWQS